jgi:hypothetical protein
MIAGIPIGRSGIIANLRQCERQGAARHMPLGAVIFHGRVVGRSARLFAGRSREAIRPRRGRLGCSNEHADGNDANETQGQTQVHSTAENSHRSPPDCSARGTKEKAPSAATCCRTC